MYPYPNIQEMVLEFHRVFVPSQTDRVPTILDTSTKELRLKLLEEEYLELREAIEEENIYHIAKELADLAYVTYGTAIAYGIDLDLIVEEVHRSNMSKLDNGKPILREDGKVLKGPNYCEPDIKSILDYSRTV